MSPLASSMCSRARVLPMPREPEWSTTQTRPCSSWQTSKKWLPDPSVPNCSAILVRSRSPRDVAGDSVLSSAGSSEGALCPLPRPAGIASSTSDKSEDRSSGSSLRTRLVRAAIMPQPMSTPTAEGTMAPRMKATEPTVAPIPTWASGMSAIGFSTNGSAAVRSAWAIVEGSISSSPHTSRFPRLSGITESSTTRPPCRDSRATLFRVAEGVKSCGRPRREGLALDVGAASRAEEARELVKRPAVVGSKSRHQGLNHEEDAATRVATRPADQHDHAGTQVHRTPGPGSARPGADPDLDRPDDVSHVRVVKRSDVRDRCHHETDARLLAEDLPCAGIRGS